MSASPYPWVVTVTVVVTSLREVMKTMGLMTTPGLMTKLGSPLTNWQEHLNFGAWTLLCNHLCPQEFAFPWGIGFLRLLIAVSLVLLFLF